MCRQKEKTTDFVFVIRDLATETLNNIRKSPDHEIENGYRIPSFFFFFGFLPVLVSAAVV